MDELYERWLELSNTGDTTEDFEDWYSGVVSDAYDNWKDRE